MGLVYCFINKVQKPLKTINSSKKNDYLFPTISSFDKNNNKLEKFSQYILKRKYNSF